MEFLLIIDDAKNCQHQILPFDGTSQEKVWLSQDHQKFFKLVLVEEFDQPSAPADVKEPSATADVKEPSAIKLHLTDLKEFHQFSLEFNQTQFWQNLKWNSFVSFIKNHFNGIESRHHTVNFKIGDEKDVIIVFDEPCEYERAINPKWEINFVGFPVRDINHQKMIDLQKRCVWETKNKIDKIEQSYKKGDQETNQAINNINQRLDEMSLRIDKLSSLLRAKGPAKTTESKATIATPTTSK